MAKELFEDFQSQKERVLSLIAKAMEYEWITQQEGEEMTRKMNDDTLTIGVIGQMKAGKSTFLNAFVFEEAVLPAATTPMTAALSTITYGPEKKIKVEFYTAQEWEEQKTTATIPIDEQGMSESQQSKIKAARELVEKSASITSELPSLLGTTREDKFERLVDYVGANGKYVAVTKSVTIFYPAEYLKGVRIVDTPGFNDPIVSREERTKQFLKEADVVLLMLCAARPFDATDREILFKHVGQCGMGKVLIGINKYDIPYSNGEPMDKIRDYVIQEIKKTGNPLGLQILSETAPIPLSAEMALIGTLPMDVVKSNPSYSKAWENAVDNFEVTTQKDVLSKSRIADLADAVKNVIEKEKSAILFKKPIAAINAKGEGMLAELLGEKKLLEEKIANLELPDYELEEREDQLKKAKRRIERKIESLGEGLDDVYEEIVRKGGRDMEDIWTDCCKRMSKMVDDWGTFESAEKVTTKLQAEMQFCVSRTLKREAENIQQECQSAVKQKTTEFFEDVRSVLERNDIEECDEILSRINRKHKVSGVDDGSFVLDFSDEEDGGLLNNILTLVNGFLAGYTLGLSEFLGNAFSHASVASDLKRNISDMQASFDGKEMLKGIHEGKNHLIDNIRKDIITELVDKLINQLDEVRNAGQNKQNALEEARKKLGETDGKIASINTQLESVHNIA